MSIFGPAKLLEVSPWEVQCDDGIRQVDEDRSCMVCKNVWYEKLRDQTVFSESYNIVYRIK